MRTTSLWWPVYSSAAAVAIGIALWPQPATPSSPTLSLFDGAKNPFDALLQRLPLSGLTSFTTTTTTTNDHDLRVCNLSVHRIRYERGAEPDPSTLVDETLEQHHEDDQENEEETLVRSIFGSAWVTTLRQKATQISSVVVTWEDHQIAAQARPADEKLCTMSDHENGSSCPERDTTSSSSSPGRQVTYEVQMWVNGWGFDAFWHPANRRLTTTDPFVILNDLPQDNELSFRVRIKVTTMAGLLAGLFATEIDGPWSDVVTLSPSKEHAIEAALAFLAANKAFLVVLLLCIGLSVLVILRLVLGYGVASLKSAAASSTNGAVSMLPPEAMMMTTPKTKRSRRQRTASGPAASDESDMEQEISDLRQELADSEAEVRRLMLFRGYGIETLSVEALGELEQELRRTLRVVQKQRRVRQSESTGFEALEETEEEEDEDDVFGNSTTVPTHHSDGLETVYEDDE